MKPQFKTEILSRNVLKVRVNDMKCGDSVTFLLSSDRHHDNPKCDQKLEKKHLDEAKEIGAGIIDAGDLFCAMQGKFDKRSSKDDIREEHRHGDYLDRLVSTAAEFYAPYAENILVFGLGNHETAILSRHETDLTSRLVERLNSRLEIDRNAHRIQAGGYCGAVRFLFSRGDYRTSKNLFYHHSTGGGGPVTRGVIQTNRMAVMFPDADVMLSGHTHDEWVVKIARQRISEAGKLFVDEQIHVRSTGYKMDWPEDGYAGFAVEKMLGPKPLGAAWLKATMRKDGIHLEITAAK